MRRPALLLTLAFAALAACTSGTEAGTDAPAQADVAPAASPDTAAKPAAVDGEAVAYYAGGCFWGVEHFLEKIDGVLDVESGYMGGTVKDPSYEQVLTHTTGHLEAVKVRYDPSKVTYEAITKRFFEIHDPTQADGQGPDIGNQYLSAVFVANDDEKATTEDLIGQLKERGYDVVTTVRPAAEFFGAEEYHQDYYVRHRKKPYCHFPVDRFGDGN